MNDVQRGLALLMKSAITGEACALPETFSMEKASDTIKRHKIATLAYDGAIRCGIERNLPEMQRLFQEYCRIMLHSEGQLRAVTEICRAFDENGIDYMPLKGCNLKRIYPKPELRQMGDADILVRKEQYARIRLILRSMGFEEGMESDHEWVWHRKDLYLELHRRLIPSYNEDYYAHFGDGWRLAKCSQGTRYALSREDEFIFIFTHFAKHFRDGGAGCRYVLDLWVYRRQYPDMDEGYIRGELERLQLNEFYENICRIVGEGPEKLALEKKCRALGLDHKVMFVGQVPYAEMEREYMHADVLVFPSFREATGSVIPEAMAKAMPVVAMNKFGAATILNEETGWLYDGNTIEEAMQSLRNALLECIEKPDEVVKRGENARKRAELFTWEKRMANYQAIYEACR